MAPTEHVCQTVIEAARHGLLNQLRDLIDKGHSVDAEDNRGWRPVHEAAAANHIECLKELLKHEETDVSWSSHEQGTALYLAAKGGHHQAVAILLDNGADPNQPDIMQNTPLMAAVRSGSVQLVRLLTAQGARVDCQQYTGTSPLHLAAAEGRDDMVRVLLDAGARLDIYEDYHISPIFTAAQYGQLSCLEALLEQANKKGQSHLASTPAEDGGSPLYLAAQEGHVHCLKALLRYGADPNALTNDPVALPIHAALEFGHYQCVDILLPVTNHGLFRYCHHSPWSLVMSHDEPACLHSLIDGGVDINYCHRVTHDDIFEPRVLAPCSHRVRFSPRVLPLVSLAMYHYPLRNAQILLNAGARVTSQGREVPPLVAALNKKDLNYVKLLISHGAPVNAYHPECLANLTLVTALYHWKGFNFLLKVGADPTLNFSQRPPDNWRRLPQRTHSLSSIQSDSESGSDSDQSYNTDSGQMPPLTFYDILKDSRQFVSKKAPTVGMILYQMLQYVTNVSLDSRIESLLEHSGDWQTLLSFTGTPRSLMHLCRVATRKSLKPKQLLDDRNLQSLPLPEPVIQHLLYSELDPEEPPKS